MAEANETLRGQTYRTVRATSDPWVIVCEGCGCVVADTDQHDLFHSKTRSIV